MNPSDRISYLLGAVVRVLLMTDRRTLDLYSLAAQLLPAIRLNQLWVLEDARRAPLGYAAWAYLSDEVSAARLRDPAHLLHASDWNEGHNLWLVDVAAPEGRLPELLRQAAPAAVRGHTRVFGARPRGDTIRPVELSLPSRLGGTKR